MLAESPRRRVPGEIKRREVELDPQVSPEEIMSREVELGCESWDFFRFGLFLNSSATDIVLVTLPKQRLRSAIYIFHCSEWILWNRLWIVDTVS